MEEVTNRAPDHPGKIIAGNRISTRCSWQVVLVPCLLAFSVVVIAFMIEDVKKGNETRSELYEIIDSLKKEIDQLKTNLRGCDQLKDEYGREKQENEKLKQKTQSQNEIIASVKEVKEKESDIKDYVQKDAEDLRTRLTELQREHDRLIWSVTEETKRGKVARAEDSENINALRKEVDHLKTKLSEKQSESDQFRDEYRRERQENEVLKQKVQSQSEIIASMKEAKERESGIRDYVQKDMEDMKTRLSKLQSELETEKRENGRLSQEIGIQREKAFSATEELTDYKKGSWWHWNFTWILIFILVVACCRCGGPDRRPLISIDY